MKKLTILLSLLSGFITYSTFGQKIQVHEEQQDLGNGKVNTLVVTIYGAQESDVEHDWKAVLKDYGAKVSSLKGGIMFGDNATIKEMGNNTVDIYTKFDVKKDEIDLVVGFDMGGAYLLLQPMLISIK